MIGSLEGIQTILTGDITSSRYIFPNDVIMISLKL
jgi:hypothetical protein